MDTTRKSTAYRNIIPDHVHSFIATMLPYGRCHFQQGNAPFHRAPWVLNRYEVRQSEFNLFICLSQSSDRNNIEDLLDEVERALRSLEMPASNLTQLTATILSALANINQRQYQQLVEYMQEEYRL